MTAPVRRPARELCVTVIHALDAWDERQCITKDEKKHERMLVTRAREAIHDLMSRIVRLPPSILA